MSSGDQEQARDTSCVGRTRLHLTPILIEGKGTQCALLVSEYDFVHLSGQDVLCKSISQSLTFLTAGDLLRAEQKREGSQYGAMIEEYIREGQVVPMEVTIKLLENAMKAAFEERKNTAHQGWADGKGRFLIDGFPRKMDQALQFDKDVRELIHKSNDQSKYVCDLRSAPPHLCFSSTVRNRSSSNGYWSVAKLADARMIMKSRSRRDSVHFFPLYSKCAGN